jgi:hypothetical protein
VGVGVGLVAVLFGVGVGAGVVAGDHCAASCGDLGGVGAGAGVVAGGGVAGSCNLGVSGSWRRCRQLQMRMRCWCRM